jgi:hypothetical protein
VSRNLGGLSENFVYSSLGFVVTRLAYGDQVAQRCGEELVALNSEGIWLATWANSQVWLVNIFPIGLSLSVYMISVAETVIARFLPSWLPGLKFPAYAKRGKNLFDKLRYWAFSQVKHETVCQDYLAVRETPKLIALFIGGRGGRSLYRHQIL